MKILSNATVTKLKENSKSYGKPETIEVAFIKEFENEIRLFNSDGTHIRNMRKGTKLLISFKGTVISDKVFNLQFKKAAKIKELDRAKLIEAREKELAMNSAIATLQLKAWAKLLIANPEKAKRYSESISKMPSNSSRKGDWRSWLKLKAAKHVNNGSFQNLMVSAPELKSTLLAYSK